MHTRQWQGLDAVLSINEAIVEKMSLITENDSVRNVGITFLLIKYPIPEICCTMCMVCWQNLLSQLDFVRKELQSDYILKNGGCNVKCLYTTANQLPWALTCTLANGLDILFWTTSTSCVECLI